MCHKSEGFGKDRNRFSKSHRLINGENLSRAWFLLMNELFLFNSRELVLNSYPDLLTLEVAQQLPKALKISEEEYFYEGCSNMNASSFITFVTYMLRQNGIRFYKGLYVTFKLAPDLKQNPVDLSSYRPLNEVTFVY